MVVNIGTTFTKEKRFKIYQISIGFGTKIEYIIDRDGQFVLVVFSGFRKGI